MVRLPLMSAALAAVLTLAAIPVAAQSTSFVAPVTDAERDAFRAEVRAYLLANPEVIFEAVAEFERRQQTAQADMDNALVEINADAIFRDNHSWVGGNPEGDLTLVEFIDYRCGFCRRAYPQVLELVESDGNLRRVIKEFPVLGPQSELMSRFAIAVQQIGGAGAYDTAHSALMTWQGDITPDDLRDMAGELGLDPETVLAAMNGDAVTGVLRANYELAQRLQISGTPTFVMGPGDSGEVLRGFMPLDEMQGAVARLRG